jgi:hypothetical protein
MRAVAYPDFIPTLLRLPLSLATEANLEAA